MRCRFCGSIENLCRDSFYRNPKTKEISRSYFACRKCNTERARKYRQTVSGKKAIARAIKKYEAKQPQRKRAWVEANKNIPLGFCVKCGKKADRHHPDH